MNIISVNKELTILESESRSKELIEAVGSHFLPFDLGPKLGDPHSTLINNNYATLSGKTTIIHF